jgi:hypothetical protein
VASSNATTAAPACYVVDEEDSPSDSTAAAAAAEAGTADFVSEAEAAVKSRPSISAIHRPDHPTMGYGGVIGRGVPLSMPLSTNEADNFLNSEPSWHEPLAEARTPCVHSRLVHSACPCWEKQF